MVEALLDKQHLLLEYLTSRHAIFDEKDRTAQPASMPEPGLLRREARFSFEKRMGKIATILPRTIAIVEKNGSDLPCQFAEGCPPTEISQVVNCQQFCDFLRARARCGRLDPPYLADVAACELAFAQVRPMGDKLNSINAENGQYRQFRRHPNAVFLSCSYDVRTVFQDAGDATFPKRRDNFLAIAIPPDKEGPEVFEIAAVLFDLLGRCGAWTDTAALYAVINQVQPIHDLAKNGLIEVRP